MHLSKQKSAIMHLSNKENKMERTKENECVECKDKEEVEGHCVHDADYCNEASEELTLEDIKQAKEEAEEFKKLPPK